MVAALVELKAIVPVYELVKFDAGNARLPYTARAPLPANVITASRPEMVKSLQFTAPDSVTVNVAVPTLLLLSKITSSADVGAVAPMAADDMVRLVSVPVALIV